MRYTGREFKGAARRAAAWAREAGQWLLESADAALVYAGDAARRRERRRAAKIALRVAGRAAVLAGTAVVSLAAARALRHRE
jgi:hypothetical protein